MLLTAPAARSSFEGRAMPLAIAPAMAITAITTISSTRVKPLRRLAMAGPYDAPHRRVARCRVSAGERTARAQVSAVIAKFEAGRRRGQRPEITVLGSTSWPAGRGAQSQARPHLPPADEAEFHGALHSRQPVADLEFGEHPL